MSAPSAARLRELHAHPPLVLPNVWDAASACAFVAAGSPALATSSSAVAATLGHADGEQMPVDEAFAAVARIARSVDVPVTADIEAGYGLAPAELVARLVEAGVSGLNLEDTDHRGGGGLVPVAQQAERVGGVVEAAAAAGVPLVLNARVDVFVRQVGDTPEERVELALERVRAYAAAGADCAYPIGALDEATWRALVAAAPLPLNGLHHPAGPPLRTLVELGVTRITFGGGLHRLLGEHLTALAASLVAGDDPYQAAP